MRTFLTLIALCIALGTTTLANSQDSPPQPGALTLDPIASHQLRLEQQEIRSELSTLWTAVTLNMITADVLSLYIPEARRKFTSFADGKEAELMLGGAIYYQIPIAMVFLSEVLPYQANRITNLVATGLVSTAIIAGGSTEPHYLAIAGFELLGLAAIAWKAWQWPDPDDSALGISNFGVGVTGDGGYLQYSMDF